MLSVAFLFGVSRHSQLRNPQKIQNVHYLFSACAKKIQSITGVLDLRNEICCLILCVFQQVPAKYQFEAIFCDRGQTRSMQCGSMAESNSQIQGLPFVRQREKEQKNGEITFLWSPGGWFHKTCENARRALPGVLCAATLVEQEPPSSRSCIILTHSFASLNSLFSSQNNCGREVGPP